MIIVVILIIILFKILFGHNDTIENMIDIPKRTKKVTWKRNIICKNKMSKIYKEFIKENNIKHSDNNEEGIYFPCSYNKISDEINSIDPDIDQYLFIIDNANEISNKNYIWDNIVNYYGLEKAKKIMPNSYLTYRKEDLDRLRNEYSAEKLYIMKKNIQRQEGLKITNDFTELSGAYENDYVIIQELLQDPYLIKGRKINMRFYILVCCRHNDVSVLVHNNGFMYYTAALFIKNSKESGPNITTGYVEREVYESSPLSHMEFRKYLDSNRKLSKIERKVAKTNVLSKYVFDNIYLTLKEIMMSIKNIVCNKRELKKRVTFQLFGADIAVNKDLSISLMEINKGPDLGYKDDKDAAIKKKVIYDMFGTLNIVPEHDNGFIELF
jgi:hypothetical protein